MIKKILFLRKNGEKFNSIGYLWNVTGNAVRKALLRHSPNFIKVKKHTIDPVFVSKHFAINWGIENKIFKKKQQDFFFNNQKISETKCIMIVNQHRKNQGIHSFKITY